MSDALDPGDRPDDSLDKLHSAVSRYYELARRGLDPVPADVSDDPVVQENLVSFLANQAAHAAGNASPNTTIPGGPGGPGAPPPPDALLPTVPGYAVEEQIGSGGFAVVYRAVELALNRVVALKILRGGTDDERRRFMNEGRAIAAVKHRNVIPIYAVFGHEGQAILALEYMSGGCLADRLRACPVASRGEAAAYAALVAKVADGVAAAHARQIIHRDLKPRNVLFDEAGEPVVADFGLARQGDSEFTPHNAMLGTLPYMSPEQAGGDTRSVGSPADVWALGVTLYECLTGTRPFVGGAYEILTQIMTTAPMPVRELAPVVPPELAAIVEKCLRRPTAERYQTAQELAAALRAFLNSGLPPPRPPEPPVGSAPDVPPPARRRRRRLAFVAAAVPVAVAAAAALTWPWSPGGAGDTLPPLDQTLVNKPPAPDWAAYARAVTGAHAEWRENPAADVRPLEDVAPNLRGWEWHYVRNLDRPAVLRATGPNAGAVYAAAFDPDGKRVATGHENGTVRIWDAAGNAGPVVLGKAGAGTGPAYAVAWSPDGRTLAAAHYDRHVRRWDVSTGEELGALSGHTDFVRGVAFSPIGGWVVTASGDRSARIWNAATGAEDETRSLRGHTKAVAGVACSRDGRWVATASWDATARIWDTEMGQSRELKHDRSAVVSAAFDRDGKRVVTACYDKTARLWDVATGGEVRRFRGHDAAVVGAAFSRDGARVVTASQDGTARVWDAGTGVQLFVLRGHAEAVNTATFSPDGARVLTASSDGTAGLWSANPKGEFTPLRGPAGPPPEPISRSGERIVSIGSDGTARVSDAQSNEVLFALKGHAGGVNAASFNPAGNRIATAGADGKARVWEATAGVELLTLEVPGGPVRAAVWSPDGSRLVTASDDGVARVWNSSPAGRPAVVR